MSTIADDPITHELSSASGLRVTLNGNGSLRRLEHGAVMVALFVGNEIEGGPANLYLRRHAKVLEWIALLGPLSPTRFVMDLHSAQLEGSGQWGDLAYRITLTLAASQPVWFWHVQLENKGKDSCAVDVTYAQDVALASYGAIRNNEFYVSQYLDHTALCDPTHGYVIASRQNLAVDGRNPWSMIGSLRKGASFATDALQFYGLTRRTGAAAIGLVADLPGTRLQHEHAMAVVRDDVMQLAAGQSAHCGFFGSYVAHHPEPTSAADLTQIAGVLALPEASSPSSAAPASPPTPTSGPQTLFSSAPALAVVDLSHAELQEQFPGPWRHIETSETGEALSFFCDAHRHVVLSAKEVRVLRPHGHLLRSGCHTTPDETSLTSTAWMGGVFHSMLTQGHVSINRMLSTVHSYLGLFRSHGQRVFVQIEGQWQLLEMPSAFEMSPASCSWIYRYAKGEIQVSAAAGATAHEMTLNLKVSAGPPLRFLISHHVAMNGDDGSAPGAALWRRQGQEIIITSAPGSELAQRFAHGSFSIVALPGTAFEKVGGDELLFLDGRSRQQPFVCMTTAATTAAGLKIEGQLLTLSTPAPQLLDAGEALEPTLIMHTREDSPLAQRTARLAEAAPWYAQNAWVHYLSPRGLEQYSGGGWGTRDVCQGPVEMLLALNLVAPIRDLLLRVYKQHNRDGDWPQWFMFFERERNIRPGDSHGDIVYWPLLVTAQYLIASGDASILEEPVRFFDSKGPEQGETATVWQHVLRALELANRRVIPGTALAAYGHGDWNDSLQPVAETMRHQLCSAWTVTLQFQTLNTLASALRGIGRATEAAKFAEQAQAVLRDFQRLLLADEVLAGYVLFADDGGIRYLLHPRDDTTGIHYSSLAMIHAILEDLLTPAQARAHLHVIRSHLSAADGVRLFDRPMAYHGGRQRLFQRAETATFFGREIGLMYTHAHLRYAQALAHIGEAEAFFQALCQANPIAVAQVVPRATLRQANCYYSSSDAAFVDRYQASTEYERVSQGTIDLDGGWRVYSSGAGIALGLIMRRFLGLSREGEILRLDPVIPAALDGLRVSTRLSSRPLEIEYRIADPGCGVKQITLNGAVLPFTRANNPHRAGAALTAMPAVLALLRADGNTLQIDLGG